MELLKKEGVRFGLMAMVTYAVSLFIFHAVSIETFSGVVFRSIPWFLMLCFAFAACVVQLKAQGGILRFPEAIVTILIVIALAELGAVLGEFILYNAVDTELPAKMKALNIEKTMKTYESFEKALEYAEGDKEEILTQVEEANYNFGLSDAVLKFVTWLFIDFLFALLLGAIVRKEPIKVE